MKKTLYLLCGVPGSGKSTWAENMAERFDGAYISRDIVRFSMVREDEDYFSHEGEVFNEFIRYINEALYLHEDVFVDATHINERSREKTLRRITHDVDIIPVVFVTPLEICLEWNSKREGRKRVPDSVIKDMKHNFTDPLNDSRGYAAVWYVDPSEAGEESE